MIDFAILKAQNRTIRNYHCSSAVWIISNESNKYYYRSKLFKDRNKKEKAIFDRHGLSGFSSGRRLVALDNPNRWPLQTGQSVLVCRVFKKLYFWTSLSLGRNASVLHVVSDSHHAHKTVNNCNITNKTSQIFFIYYFLLHKEIKYRVLWKQFCESKGLDMDQSFRIRSWQAKDDLLKLFKSNRHIR